MLRIRDLSVKFKNFKLGPINFDLKEGDWLMVVGPNGTGKSTLVKAINQGLPYTGRVDFQGKDLSKFKAKDRAKRIACLAQNHGPISGFTVKELVAMGRYPFLQGFFKTFTKEDLDLVDQALELVKMEDFKEAKVETLSGGEFQRVLFAQAYIQDPNIMILDEPTNHLDPKYQKEVLDLTNTWRQKSEKITISVIHDLVLAYEYGTKFLILDGGRQVGYGDKSVLTREKIEEVYGVDFIGWKKEILEKWD